MVIFSCARLARFARRFSLSCVSGSRFYLTYMILHTCIRRRSVGDYLIRTRYGVVVENKAVRYFPS